MEKFKYVSSVRYNGGELIMDEENIYADDKGNLYYNNQETDAFEQFQLKVRDRLGIKISQK